ncbi:hypothetical protein [Vibrio phage LP.1]|nr:hypothetical protein [Vibrio phage LP.1]
MPNLKTRIQALTMALLYPDVVVANAATIRLIDKFILHSAVRNRIDLPADKLGQPVEGSYTVQVPWREVEAEIERRYREGL